MSSSDNIEFTDRARLLIGLKIPYRYSYLITSELVERGAEFLRSGVTFEVLLDEERLGAGFDAVTSGGIGHLPGVTGDGISAGQLIRLVPHYREGQDGI